jgi:hypothetical protein
MGLFGGKPQRAATNAPRDWPEVVVKGFSADVAANYLQVAAELKRGFDAQRRPVELAFFRSRLYDDGVVEVPLEVALGEQRTAVFVYSEADSEAAGHYSAMRSLLREREQVSAVYYAPGPIQPAKPAIVLDRIETDHFSLPEGEPAPRTGEYALWWPTAEEPRFTGSKAADYLTRAFTALDGYQSYAFSAFAFGLRLAEPKKDALLALPETPLSQPLDGPGGLRLVMYAFEERGLWFAFERKSASTRDRNTFLKLWAEFAEWFAAELKKGGVPPREEDRAGLRWWIESRDHALQKEAAGDQELIVGRIMEGADRAGGGLTEMVSTATGREGAPSERLTTLVFDAFDDAVETVEKSPPADGQPALHAFLWMRSGDKTYTTRFFMIDEPEAVKACRKAAAEWPDADHGVLVCDGFLREGAKRTDALVAHAYERGASHTHVFALKYAPARKGQPFRTIGDALLFAREAPLFD